MKRRRCYDTRLIPGVPDANAELNNDRIELEDTIMPKPLLTKIRIVLNRERRLRNNVSEAQVVQAVLHTTVWKRSDTQQDAHCEQCCPDGQPLANLSYSGYLAEASSDVFLFEVKPRCSSTRYHQGGAKLVMVITGIPHSITPLASLPITFTARTRRLNSQSLQQSAQTNTQPQSGFCSKECKLTETMENPVNCASNGDIQVTTHSTLNTFGIHHPPVSMPIISRSGSSVPQCVVAVSSQNVMTFSGPVVLVAIAYSTCVDKILRYKPKNPIAPSFFSPLTSENMVLMGSVCISQEQALAVLRRVSERKKRYPSILLCPIRLRT